MPSRYPTLAAGDLRQGVTWRQFDPTAGTPDARGWIDPSTQFVEKGRHYARIVPLSGAALVVASQYKLAIWVEITLRVIGAVKGFDQLVYDGTTYTVEYSLGNDLSQQFLTVHATAEPLNPTPQPS